MTRSPGQFGKNVTIDPVRRDLISRAFLAMAVVHELRQPLNSLTLNAELIAQAIARNQETLPTLSGPVASLGRVADQMARCLESYCERARPEPVPEERADIVPLLNAVARLGTKQGRARKVKVEAIAEGLPLIPFHAEQVMVALEELVDNAVRASKPGDRVTVRASQEADELRVEVIDEGKGMSNEERKSATKIGYSTWGGEGIGLTIAKFIAYHHVGGFQLSSPEGKGTTVALVFPLDP